MPAVLYIMHIVFHPISYDRGLSIVIALARRIFDVHLWVYVLWGGKNQIFMFLASKVVYQAIWKNCKRSAPGEDRTHGLQIARVCVIMRLTRYLLRYRGTCSELMYKPFKFFLHKRIEHTIYKPMAPLYTL